MLPSVLLWPQAPLWQLLRPGFWGCWQFLGELVRCFIECPISRKKLSSLMIRVGCGVLKRKTTEVTCHFHHIMWQACIVNMTLLVWPWSPGWAVFVKFLHCILILPLLHTVLFKRKLLCATHMEAVRSSDPPPWRNSIYINYMWFWCLDLSHLPKINWLTN